MKWLFIPVLTLPCLVFAQQKVEPKAGWSLYPELGYSFPRATIISLGVNYIHPQQFGARFTYRKYFAKSEDEPANFKRCNHGLFEYREAPPDEADYYELVMIRRIHTNRKIAVLLEAGPHLSLLNEMRFWRTPGSISNCYHFGHTRYMLGGVSAYGGFEFAVSRYFGIQAGLNALINSKRQIVQPEISLLFGKLR